MMVESIKNNPNSKRHLINIKHSIDELCYYGTEHYNLIEE